MRNKKDENVIIKPTKPFGQSKASFPSVSSLYAKLSKLAAGCSVIFTESIQKWVVLIFSSDSQQESK